MNTLATVITEKTIKSWISSGENIESADAACAEGIKYDLRLGTKFLKAHFGRMADFSQLSSDEKWKSTFKSSLSSVSEKLTEISSSLKVEIEVRQKEEDALKRNDEKLNAAVEDINKNILSFNAWVKILVKILIAILSVSVPVAIGLLINYLSKMLL